jgi:DnaJ-domain-containing protein 1
MGLEEALAILGVAPGDDRETIEHAYRERSRTCHPDKVAHLDAEFVALAERKFRRLQQAYELLVG